MVAPTELHTDRLHLRPFQASDVADVLEYRNDEAFVQFLAHVRHPFTEHHAQAFVAQNMTEPWERFPTFAVVLDGKLIGTVNLEVEAGTRAAMLGYAIGRAWWGRGIGTEAAGAVVTWAIEAFDLTRIWASTDARHNRSRRVLEKLGMRAESLRIEDHIGRDGRMVDEVVYALEIRARNVSVE